MDRRRRVPQHEQEHRSRHQLALCWAEWSLQSSVEDLGEDLHFQIYADGKSTGLSFYVQLKSTADIESLRPKRDRAVISYPFETKDFLHWENSVPPVVLVVWDVEKERGVWLDVPAALKQLDARSPRWRTRKSASVAIPRKHSTNARGRDTLRATIAHLAMPMLSAGKETTVSQTFSFPKTAQGRAALKALQRTIDEGGSTTVPAKYIKEFRMSEWWERAYGVRIPEFVTFSSGGEPIALPLEVQVVGPQRTEVISVNLRRTKQGRKQATFETDDVAGPVAIAMVFQMPVDGQMATSVKIRFQHPCRTVHDTLAVTRLLIALRQGGILQLILPGGSPIPQPNFDLSGGRPLKDLLGWEKVLQMLSYIQTRVAAFGSFSVEQLRNEDLSTIQRLWTILRTGELSGKMSFRADYPQGFAGKATEVRADGGIVELLGVRIPVGEVRMELQDTDALALAAKRAASSKAKKKVLVVAEVPVIQRFVDWGPNGKGPKPVRLSSTSGRASARVTKRGTKVPAAKPKRPTVRRRGGKPNR